MVLESLIGPTTNKPLKAFCFGVFSASIGLLLAYWVFREHSSLVMVFLTTLAAVPFTYYYLKVEEKADVKLNREKDILTEHYHAIIVLMALFLGMSFGLNNGNITQSLKGLSTK